MKAISLARVSTKDQVLFAYIVAFSFGKGAYEEVAGIKKEGLFIDLLTVDKLLGFSEEKVSDKMFEFY